MIYSLHKRRKEVDKVFCKILKKDLKRKKAMNSILLLFMIAASTLISGSVNMLYTTTTAMEQFTKVSKLADNIIIASSNEKNNELMEEWAKTSSKVKSIKSEYMLKVTADNITIPKQYKNLKNQNTFLLTKMPNEYNLVFNQKDERFKLKDGEVALPIMMNESTGIQLNDKIKIKIGECEKEFTVKYYIKDILFGSGIMTTKRIIISDNDFNQFYKEPNKAAMKLWSINKADAVTYDDVEKDFSKTSIDAESTINNDSVSFTYVMDLITAAIMIIVSIVLIFISFLILRFTIVFTIEEDYKEIGIMKAIGLKNINIKSIYMVKYFSVALVGGGIGFAASIPFADYLMDSISTHIIMKNTLLNYVLSVASVLFIIALTVGFCYMCTRKINKVSAIDAIRRGSIGESFTMARRLKLHKMKHISTPMYLALNDLMCVYKKFIILIIVFILGTVIIIIPINIINTLNSNNIITLFGLSKTDFNIGAINLAGKYNNSSIDILMKDLQEIEKKARDKEVDIKLFPEVNESLKIYTNNQNESKSVYSFQAYDYSTDNYTYLSGMPPKQENEIAITTVTADYFGIGLGDTINCKAKGKTTQYIVTGLYQSMINMGYSVRFSEKHPINLNNCSGISVFGLINDKITDKNKAIKTLKGHFPELDIKSGKEYMESFMGSTIGQLGLIKNIILTIVLGVNFLITTLLVRMLIAKEITEIAVLKSIGFKNKHIRKWQTTRITIILIISIILGTLIANLAGGFLTAGLFKMMGATQMKLSIEPLQVFVIYPIIILVVTTLSVLSSLGKTRNINVWGFNNQE